MRLGRLEIHWRGKETGELLKIHEIAVERARFDRLCSDAERSHDLLDLLDLERSNASPSE